MFYCSKFTSLVYFWPPPIFNPGYAYAGGASFATQLLLPLLWCRLHRVASSNHHRHRDIEKHDCPQVRPPPPRQDDVWRSRMRFVKRTTTDGERERRCGGYTYGTTAVRLMSLTPRRNTPVLVDTRAAVLYGRMTTCVVEWSRRGQIAVEWESTTSNV